MIIRQATVILGTSAVLSASAAAANMLGNPSFEEGTGSVTFAASTEFGGAQAFELTSPSGEIQDWVWEQTEDTTGGAAWLRDTGDLFGTDGDHLLYLDPNQCIQWVDTAGLSAGEIYTFDYNIASWTRSQDVSPTDPIESGDATLLLEYNYVDGGGVTRFGNYTGGGDIVAPANGSSAPTGLTWVSGSWDFTVPGDYASDFKFVVTSTGGMALDNLSVMPVPEPSSAGLLGLALVGLLARRKR